MDFFDDETSRAPADAGGPPSAPSSRRRPSDRRRTRIQRLVILALILFIVVFGLAWWARSCQHNRKVGTYETYFAGVSAAIDDSVNLGKQVSAIMLDPTKLSRNELVAKLGQLSAQQEEIAVRAGRLEPPGTLEDEQTVFSTGMKVRANGFSLLPHGHARRPRQQEGRRQGDHRPRRLLQRSGRLLPAARVRAGAEDDGRTTASAAWRCPTSTYYLTWKALDPATVTATLDNVGKSPKMTGIHGVAPPRRVRQEQLRRRSSSSRERPTTCRPRPTSPSSRQVQNQGSVTEKQRRRHGHAHAPRRHATIKQEASIATIEAGKTQDVTITGFAIPDGGAEQGITLKVVAGPVKGERVETNNTATYKLLLQLQ